MDASVDICWNLQRAKIDSLEINLVAGLISAGRASEVQGTLDTLKVKATSSFEFAYNIAVQLAYVQQLLGHTQKAVGAYTDIVNQMNHHLQWQ